MTGVHHELLLIAVKSYGYALASAGSGGRPSPEPAIDAPQAERSLVQKEARGECGQRGVETDGRSNGDDKRITAGGRIMTRRMRRRDCVLVTVRRAARPVCQTNTDSAVGRGLHVGVSLTDVRYRTHLITLTNSFTVLLDYRPVELGEGGLLGR